MTDNVTTSASLIFGVIPTLGRAGACSGELFNKSSTRTYSAVATVSRSASTMSLQLDVGFQRRSWTPSPQTSAATPLTPTAALGTTDLVPRRQLGRRPKRVDHLADLRVSV